MITIDDTAPAVTADTLFYLVRRLANQMPVRYYMDARGDGSYSHVALELYFPAEDSRFPAAINRDLETLGFTEITASALPEHARWTGSAGHRGQHFIRHYEAVRDMTAGGSEEEDPHS